MTSGLVPLFHTVNSRMSLFTSLRAILTRLGTSTTERVGCRSGAIGAHAASDNARRAIAVFIVITGIAWREPAASILLSCEAMSERANIDAFLACKRIAFAGVSTHAEDFSREVMRALIDHGI